MPNVLDAQYRKSVIEGIRGTENQYRKNDSLKRYDIYQKRQARYLREKLIKEYSEQTVNEMRLISSVNLGRRIVDEKASLYVKAPTRSYERHGGAKLTENEELQLDQLAKLGCLNETMKKANRYYKLENQCAIQIIPKQGVIQSRVLLPHHYDVIPREDDPERAFAYIINVYDRSLLYNQTFSHEVGGSNYLSQSQSDGLNQTIADSDDSKAAALRFIWWTEEYNFITDGFGNMVDELGNVLQFMTVEDLQKIVNPIARLPFVDVASEKEFEFWVRLGNDVIDFCLDFSVLLSDTAEINKRQGYSQAIVYSEEVPKDMVIGPHRILHMKLDPNKEQQPKFEWATPTPDMQAALELLRTYLVLFLTSEGMHPETVSTQIAASSFSSGVERLLAMIDKFEASADDISLFERVEQEVLQVMVAWSNALQGATIEVGVQPLVPRLQTATLPDDVDVHIHYEKPEAVQSQNEVEDSVIKRMDNMLMSRTQAIIKLDGVTEDQAKKTIAEIDAEMEPQVVVPPPTGAGGFVNPPRPKQRVIENGTNSEAEV